MDLPRVRFGLGSNQQPAITFRLDVSIDRHLSMSDCGAQLKHAPFLNNPKGGVPGHPQPGSSVNRSIALQQPPERAGSAYYAKANGEHDLKIPTQSIVVRTKWMAVAFEALTTDCRRFYFKPVLQNSMLYFCVIAFRISSVALSIRVQP